MKTKTVPLVIYENGVRRIIGESVVDMDDQNNLIVAISTITDSEYQTDYARELLKGLSIGDSESAIISKEPYVKPEEAKEQWAVSVSHSHREQQNPDR